MTRDEWSAWFRDEGGLAALWKPAGLFARGGEVPPGAIGFPLEDGERTLEAGDSFRGAILLVRPSELTVPVTLPELADAEGVEGRLQATLVVDPPRSRVAALLVRDHLLADRERAGSPELALLLRPHLLDGVRPLLHQGRWDGDTGVLKRLRNSDFIAHRLHGFLFGMGLSLERVAAVELDSPLLIERNRRAADLEQETRRLRERLEFIDLWRRQELGEVLARAEVEKMAAHLRNEGLLRAIDQEREVARHRIEHEKEEARARGQMRRMLERERLATEMELDADRLEHEIERARRLESALKESGLLGMIHSLEDPVQKARLLELVIEREMTPEQIRARGERVALARVEEDLGARLGALATELRAGAGRAAGPVTWRNRLARMERVWVAAGLGLHRIDGDAALRGGSALPVLPPEDLGHLRSVHVEGRGAEATVLVGAQGGVFTYRPSGSHWTTHRFRDAPHGHGGVNSVATTRDFVLATHSELGLHIWERARGGRSRQLFPERIIAGRPTRGVQCGPEGAIYFSHGAAVYRLDAADPAHAAVSCGDVSDSITALEADARSIVAGTRDGRIYRWQGGTDWRPLPFQAAGPIYQIQLARRDDRLGWIVGAREPAVQILDEQGERVAEYQTRNPIRWVAAGEQCVLGVDRFGQNLLVWEWQEPSAPRFRLRVPDQIHSLAVEWGGES